MFKLLSTLSVILAFVTSCQQAPKPAAGPEAPAATTSQAGFTTTGPDVELLKKAYQAYEKGDWATLRSAYSDSAVTVSNVMATDENIPRTPIDSAIAMHKYQRENIYEGMSINSPIYEVVTTDDGSKYGHVWSKLTTKVRKTGATINVAVFGSYGIKDGKLTFEWLLFNQPPAQ